MYRIDRNNFHKNIKESTVYTPEKVSDFLFKILNKNINKKLIIADFCVGKGSLLKPWIENGFNFFGSDIEDQGFKNVFVKNFLELKKNEIPNNIGLVIMNPPFNIDNKTKKYIKNNYSGRPLLPEIWLQKTIELLGNEIPIVLFTPYGFRLNQTLNSKRYKKFLNKKYPEIKSIISLPKDIFLNVKFHSEILIFNLKNLKGHYFYHE